MSIRIFSQAFKFNVYDKNTGKLMMTHKCYLNEIKKILDNHGLEFVEMDKTGSESWTIIVNPDSRWKLEY